MLRITLNTDVQSMFPLLGLTWESPGPIEVDPTKLPEQHMLWIKNAQARNVLKVEDLNPVVENVQTKSLDNTKSSTEWAKVAKAEQATQLKKQAAETRSLKEEEAKKTLRAPVSALSSFVNNSTDLLMLRTMLSLEQGEGKKRPKVIDLLNKKINELQLSVGSIVGEPLDDKAQLVTDRHLKNLPEVQEEEEKTVTISME